VTNSNHPPSGRKGRAKELEKLQETIWRKGIGEGRALGAVVDEIFDATLPFLGVKAGAAVQDRCRERARWRAA
jgi:hypothetical protein